MEYELIKQSFKLGNSAGVLLPIEWRDRKVAVKLIEKSISQEVFDLLEQRNLLKNIIGIFLAGSYARGEETESSDIDVLIVTDSIDRQIKRGKYDVVFVPKEKLDTRLRTNLYLASLINEAKAILNDNLLKYYKTKIKGISLKKQLAEIKSVTKINEGFVNLDEESGDKVLDETIYSLVLRLRELYLIKCLKKDKSPSNNEFVNLIKTIAGGESYCAYLRIKNDLKLKKIVPVKEANALIAEIKRRINELEHGKKK